MVRPPQLVAQTYQPMYPAATQCDVLLPPPHSTQFPADTPTCQWWNGMVTHLPFTVQPEQTTKEGGTMSSDAVRLLSLCLNPYSNSAQDTVDADLVRWASVHAKDATAPTGDSGDPLVDVYAYSGDGCMADFVSLTTNIRQSLSHGRSVVVRGWEAQPLGWNTATAQHFLGGLDRPVEWQGGS